MGLKVFSRTFNQPSQEFMDFASNIQNNSGIPVIYDGTFPQNVKMDLNLGNVADAIYCFPYGKFKENVCLNPNVINMTGQYPFSCVLHELAHATGHPKRLNRITMNPKNYHASVINRAVEEIIAETTAMGLMEFLGLADGDTMARSEGYINKWLQDFKKEATVYPSSELRDEMRKESARASEYILNKWIKKGN